MHKKAFFMQNIVKETLPWIIWALVVDKKRLKELLLYGCLVSIISIWLDAFGSSMVLWVYPNRLLPAIPPFKPFDMALIPVTYMIIYQVFGGNLKIFLMVSTIMALVAAFIAEPIFHWIGYYKLVKWKYYYSFPFYIIVALLAFRDGMKVRKYGPLLFPIRCKESKFNLKRFNATLYNEFINSFI